MTFYGLSPKCRVCGVQGSERNPKCVHLFKGFPDTKILSSSFALTKNIESIYHMFLQKCEDYIKLVRHHISMDLCQLQS